MADIPLRTYLRQIDQHIEQKQFDEAISHCKHILSYYPKNIETYRLLGKALLEKGRHGDAADIFQRVLSAVPDDFVSHVGMAIVREDEANLEAALWHMERAFESSPSNPAVQEELRRLYGRRDGVVPPRARLTRGGLARLYARGDLFTQAEAELRAALAEDPERLDLRALLARVLAENGRRAEAAEVAIEVLRKLPYNQEANRLLVSLLIAQNRADEARPYQQRLRALDPYEPLTDGLPATPIRDEAVRVPLLVYDPDRPAAVTPDWAESLGADIEAVTPAVSADEPEWLRPATDLLSAQTGALTGDLTEALTGELPEPGEVPEWMRDMEPISPPVTAELPDWIKATTGVMASPSLEAEEQPKNLTKPTGWLTSETAVTALGKPATTPLAEGEIPDWLKDLVPPLPSKPAEPSFTEMLGEWQPTAPLADEGPTARLADDLPDWLKTGALDVSAPLRSAEGEPTRPLGSDEPTQLLGGDELPAWLKNISPATGAASTEDMPDWLKPVSPTDLDELPPWLATVGGTAAASGAEALPLPDWLQAVPPEKPAAPPEEPPAAAAAEAPSPAVELPDFLQPASPEAIARANAPVDWDSSPTLPDEEAAIEAGEVPDWVKAMAPRDSAPAISAADLPPIALEEVPDWLRTPLEAAQPSVKPVGEAVTPAAEETSTSPTLDVPAWAEPAPPGTSETIAGWLQAKDMPDWLREMRAQARAEEQAAEAAPVEQPIADLEQPLGEPNLPDWLTITPEQPAALATAASDIGAPSEDDSLLRWLESLAARQGADPAELITTPEERAAFLAAQAPLPAESAIAEPAPAEPTAVEEMPDRPKTMMAPPEAAAAPPVAPAVAEAPASPASAMPDVSALSEDDALRWLESLAARQGADPAELITTPEERAAFLAAQAPLPAESAIAEPAPAEPTAVEEMPDRPKTMMAPPEAAAAPPVAPAVAEAPASPASAMPDVSALSEDDALRWLESLAARQGADPAELITTPEERAAFLAAQAPLPAESAIAEPAPAEPTAVEEMPDRPKTMMAPPEAAAAPPVAPAVAEAPASPASAMPDVSALSEDDALRWLESLAARPTPITEELRSMVAEPESPLAEEPTPEPVIEPPDWVKAPPVAPAPPPAKPPATSALGRDERLARLAERLSAARRAREQEIAERIERERAEREAAWREVQQRMEERRARHVELGTGPLRRRAEAFPAAEAKPETTPSPAPAPAKPEPVVAHLQSARLPADARLTRRPRKSRKSAFAGQTHTAVLGQAQTALQSNEPAEAEARFEYLIRSGHKLDEVIVELEAYLARNPASPIFLRLLGDAYMRAGRLQKALDAYREALVKL
ncbi:MAG: tetratricopeptide repeat protein [Anaerolineales bacterium]|nr:tetratricopeptide repeat protein [Anaerolineales bacterium]